MAPHSSTLAWKIPWMEEPGRLQSMGSLSRTRLSDFTFPFHFHALEKEMAPTPVFLPGESQGHDSATSLSLFTFLHWRRKWHPLQCSCLENPREGGA